MKYLCQKLLFIIHESAKRFDWSVLSQYKSYNPLKGFGKFIRRFDEQISVSEVYQISRYHLRFHFYWPPRWTERQRGVIWRQILSGESHLFVSPGLLYFTALAGIFQGCLQETVGVNRAITDTTKEKFTHFYIFYVSLSTNELGLGSYNNKTKIQK